MTTIVLGGGIGGLSTAFYLLNSGRKIILLEATDRVGGWIRSNRLENGTIFELGPRTIRPVGERGANTLELAEKLNLKEKIRPILKSHPSAKNRMIYSQNKLHSLPNSIGALFRTTPPFTKPIASALIHDFKTKSKKVHDESIYDFTERRFGKELADLAISPMICGICAGDAKEISVKFLLKNLFEQEQKYGGIIKGVIGSMFERNKVASLPITAEMYKKAKTEKWSVWSLENGLETLPQTLEEFLKRNKVDIRLKSACENIKFYKDRVEVQTNGENIVADHVYSALPSHQLKNIFDDVVLKEKLEKIKYVTVGVVNVEYKGKVLKEEGFGFLVPPCENKTVLGVIFDSCSFPQDNKTILTVMMGGKWFKQQFGENPTEEILYKNAVQHISDILKITKSPSNFKISVLRDCIPQYTVGHFDIVDDLRNYIRSQKLPLTLVGSAYDGVGINDVVYSARVNVQCRPS